MQFFLPRREKKKQINNLQEPGLDSNVYQIPKDETMQEAWRTTKDLLVMMRDKVNQKGAEFFVTTLSTIRR